jgi:guanine nucleotide-binding protein subunit alpha
MHEALMLFESTANSVHFEKSGIILMLSDVDRFREKIESGLSPVQRYFPDYCGKSCDVAASQEFFLDKFRGLVRNPSKEVYFHFISVHDTDILEKIRMSTQDIIVQRVLESLIR